MMPASKAASKAAMHTQLYALEDQLHELTRHHPLMGDVVPLSVLRQFSLPSLAVISIYGGNHKHDSFSLKILRRPDRVCFEIHLKLRTPHAESVTIVTAIPDEAYELLPETTTEMENYQ